MHCDSKQSDCNRSGTQRLESRLLPRLLQLPGLILALIFLLPTQFTFADEPFVVVVQEVFLELRTGPGRGFPVQYAISRGDIVEVLKQRAGWVKVRDKRKRSGWVRAAEIEKTLTLDGESVQMSRSRFSLGPKHRFEGGVMGGTIAGDPMFGLRMAAKLSDTFAGEVSFAKVTGNFSSSDLLMANIVAIPMAGRRWSPFFALGYGRLKNDPNRSLVGAASTSRNFYSAGGGVRYEISRALILRADYKRYNLLISDEANDEYDEFSVGLSFTF